jgi:TonB-linked SusC/RagA family outer membrane protein
MIKHIPLMLFFFSRKGLLVFTLLLYALLLKPNSNGISIKHDGGNQTGEDFQQFTVSGTVLESGSNSPLIGVTVMEKGTTNGTVTNQDGYYTLTVAGAESVLLFSYIGYLNEEIPIHNKTTIDIVLAEDIQAIDEVVVIGYGTVKKSDLTGSVSSVKADDIIKITSISPEQALQGKVPGVQVTSTSGAPGGLPVVRIRGVGTFNNSSPIFVVDGVILDNISFLNSSDIESVEVLKDASATAIYGSRGANGVIIITTKTGKSDNQDAVFNYTGEYSIQKLAKKIELLSGRDFATISNEISPGSYNNVDAVPNTDWQDIIFDVAPMHSHQLSATGGTGRMQYYAGLGYLKQEGIIQKSNYERVTFKLNNTYSLTKAVKFGNNITISPFKQQNAPNVVYAVYRAQPVLAPYYSDGSFAAVRNVGNPLASLAYSNNYNQGVRGVGNLFAEIVFLKNFKFRTSLGIDALYSKSKNFTPAYAVLNADGTESQQQNVFSDLYKGNTEKLTWLWENTINYHKTFEKHTLDALAGYTMQNATSESISLSGENIIRDGEDLWYIRPSYIYDEVSGVNTIQSISNSVDNNYYYSMISYLFRANYTYDNRYILTATFRRDGSSKFSKENRYSNFPSFAVGWNISEENFMEAVPLISKLKIRASWGMIGNEKIEYRNRYSAVTDFMAIFGSEETSVPGASYGKSGNPDLRWETTRQTDVGLETGFLNNRLTAEFDFYNRITDDILIELSTPGHLGNGQGQKITYNAASVLNRGYEFMVNWRDSRREFKYGVGVLGSTVHNEVLDIGGNSGTDSVLIGGYLGNGVPVTQSRVGIPIGAFYGYVTDGVFQDQAGLDAYPHTSQAGIGDLRFVDVNHDSIINGNDRTYIGSSIPKFIFGFNFNIEYKGFDFSIDFQGQTGNKIFNGKDVVRPDPYNFESHVKDRWTGAGTSNKEPRPSWGGYNYTASDRFILDGSYIRLRNITLGYTLPQDLSEKLTISRLRVYVKGTNMYTWTKFTGYTPEIASEDVLSNGIDKGGYPVSAVYSIGINLTF